MKYKVHATYTPDDPGRDRNRQDAEFEGDTADLLELAFLAYLAVMGPETESHIRDALRQSDVAGQLEDQDVGGFEFLTFPNSWEWCFEVEPDGGV